MPLFFSLIPLKKIVNFKLNTINNIFLLISKRRKKYLIILINLFALIVYELFTIFF
jgi:hypothetical protein